MIEALKEKDNRRGSSAWRGWKKLRMLRLGFSLLVLRVEGWGLPRQKGGLGLPESPPLAVVRSADEAGRHDKMPVTVSHKEVIPGTQQTRLSFGCTNPLQQRKSITYKERASPSETSSLPFGVGTGILGP